MRRASRSTRSLNPTDGADAVTKSYVDALSNTQGLMNFNEWDNYQILNDNTTFQLEPNSFVFLDANNTTLIFPDGSENGFGDAIYIYVVQEGSVGVDITLQPSGFPIRIPAYDQPSYDDYFGILGCGLNTIINVGDYWMVADFQGQIITDSDIDMTNGTFTQCEGVLYDSGGDLDNYSSNEDYTLTICPDGSGTSTVLEFISFVTQGSGTDELTIFNGTTTSDPILGTYSGTQTLGTITAANTSGCSTLRFVSKGGVHMAGFAATISCESPCQDIEALIENVIPAVSPTGVLVIGQGDNVIFDGTANFSIDGTGASYDWDFGDGNTAEGTSVNNTFTTIGTYTVTLTVTDSNSLGCSDTTTLTVQVLGDYIEVDETTFTTNELVEDVLIDSPCADISNIVTSTGSDFGSTNGIAYFSSNGENFPFTEGIILSTGNAVSAEGPEDGTIGDGSFDWPGDADLENVIPDLAFGDTNNATYIQFDFTPYSENISFNFLFASEEYGSFQCQYTDSFAFLLTDVATGITTNLAIVPSTTDPISVLSVRDNAYNPECPSSNAPFFAAY